MNRRTPINLTTNCCLVHYFKQPRLSSVQLSIFFISSTTLHGLSLKSSSTTAWLSQDFSWPGWVDLYPVLYCTVLYCTDPRTSRGLAGWTWWPRCPTSPSPSPPPSPSTSTSLSTAPSTRSLLLWYLMVVVVTF